MGHNWEGNLKQDLAAEEPHPEPNDPAWLGNLPKILRDLGVAVVVWDEEVPVYISPLFCDLIGYSAAELGVRERSDRRPSSGAAGSRAGAGAPGEGLVHYKQGADAPVPPFEFKLMHEFEWTLMHRRGHRVYVEAAAGTIEVGGRVETIGIFCDRSEQERLEEERRVRARQQGAVVELGQLALAGAELETLMDRAVNILTKTLDVGYARLLELAVDGHAFIVRAGVGWDDAGPGGHTVDLRLRSQAGYTLVSDVPVVVDDFEEEGRYASVPLSGVSGPAMSGVSVIVRGDRQAWGVLCAHTNKPRRFSPDDVKFLQAVANVLGEAIAGKSVQDALRRAGDQERALREDLEAHSRVVVAAQEAERRRIARELHDEVGQALTGLALSLANLERQAPPKLRAGLERARAGMGELVSRVHDFSLSLRPAMLDDLGLLPALLWLLEHVHSAQTGLQVDLEHQGLDRRFSWDVETAAYRIVQEALNNVARHGATFSAAVRCLVEGEELFIEIRDSGVGFNPRTIPPHTTSGLRGMQERARLLGGLMRIESEPGKGTIIAARLPIGGGIGQGSPAAPALVSMGGMQ